MNPVANFGIVTACHAGDYFMVKATCASIRRYMPDVPICVIVDGDFSILELEQAYGVLTMRPQDCESALLREMCSRSTRSKLIAQWEGPFATYLWVDCDTIVLGDWLQAEPWHEADFWAMTTIKPGTVPEENIRHFFFHMDLLRKHDAQFDPNQHPLFCDGAYVARRGCLDLERTYLMWRATLEQPTLFSWTKSMGLTNYIVFSALDRQEISVRTCNRQYIIPDHSKQETEERFGTRARIPKKDWPTPEVVHFCGQKPLIQNWRAYSSLFTGFRIAHYRNRRGWLQGWLNAVVNVTAEETSLAWKRISKKCISAI